MPGALTRGCVEEVIIPAVFVTGVVVEKTKRGPDPPDGIVFFDPASIRADRERGKPEAGGRDA